MLFLMLNKYHTLRYYINYQWNTLIFNWLISVQGDSNRGLAVPVPVFEGRHRHIHCTLCIVSSPRCLSRVVQTTSAPVNQMPSNVVMHRQYKLSNDGHWQLSDECKKICQFTKLIKPFVMIKYILMYLGTIKSNYQELMSWFSPFF